MKTRTIEELKAAMDAKGYAFFENGLYNVNIIGVRSSKHEVTNHFDDTIHVIYRKETDGDLIIESFPITTDPGEYWMDHPLNKDGCAILVPNQYNGCYQIGKHKGKYESLVQRGKVKVYRDNDRDNEYDFDSNTIQEGLFGINIHRSNPYGESAYVNKWSAGCQVFKAIDDFARFMSIMKKSASLYGNKFTYTLLLEEDIPSVEQQESSASEAAATASKASE